MASSTNGLASVETLAEVFRCCICMENLRDTRMCPHCSKLCCYPCIRRWLTEQHQCPHCRTQIHLHDLVNCRWAEEVTTQIDTLKTNESSKQKREDKDKCELHKEKLTVYCSTCSKCICHQCALFNGSHTGHSFLPLDDVYKTNVSTVNEQLGKLKRRHIELLCLTQDIERNIDRIKTSRDEKMREIQNAVHAMHTKLDGQYKIKMDSVTAQHLHLTKEIEIIERALHDIEHRLSTNGKAEVIGRQQDLLNMIQMICRKSMTNFIIKPISCDFPSEIIPTYNSSTFIITNFSFRQQNIDPIYSQPLFVNGLTWRLKVYPIGNGTVRGTYLSVFLELTNGLNESSKYEYRIEMIHHLSNDPTKNLIREFSSDFEVGECWGYNRFFLLDALINEGFIDIENDILTLRFQVRPPTYQQKCRDQRWYIKHLENENEQLNNEIKILRGQLLSLQPMATGNDDENEVNSTININETIDNSNGCMSIELDQSVSNEAENVLPENDIEADSSTSLPIQLTSIEQNDSPRITTVKSNEISDNINNEIQTTFNAGKYRSSIPLSEALPLITNEDFILADILERSANDEESINEHSNDNSSNVSSLIDMNNLNERFSYHSPQYNTSSNNLMLFNSIDQQQNQTRTNQS